MITLYVLSIFCVIYITTQFHKIRNRLSNFPKILLVFAVNVTISLLRLELEKFALAFGNITASSNGH